MWRRALLLRSPWQRGFSAIIIADRSMIADRVMERSACLLILLVGSARGRTCTGHHQCPPLTFCLFPSNSSPRCVQCSVCRVFPNELCLTPCDTLCEQDERRCEDGSCVHNSARCDGEAVSKSCLLGFEQCNATRCTDAKACYRVTTYVALPTCLGSAPCAH